MNILFTKQQKKLCLHLQYNWVNRYLFVNGVEIYILKTKDSKISAIFPETFQLIT